MSVLATYAAGAPPGVIALHCLELSHPDWASPVRIVEQLDDVTVTLETAASVTFLGVHSDGGSAWSSTHPSIDETGRASRGLQIADPEGDIYALIEAVRGSDVPVECVLRVYLSGSLSAPQYVERLQLEGAQPTGGVLNTTAKSLDVSNRPFPALRHTYANSPGLRGRS